MVKALKKKTKVQPADIIIFCIILLLVAVTVVPFMNLLAVSLSSRGAVLRDRTMLFPREFTLGAYAFILKSPAIYKSFFITLAITATATAVHLFITVLAGAALSQKALPFRRTMMLFVLFTMLFSGGLVPYYLVISQLGLIDTFWVLSIPGTASAFSIILMKNFIMQIPGALIDAAEMDGAGPLRVTAGIIVPLSLPIIATLSLFCAVGKWNDWFTAYIFIKKAKHLLPLQNVLQNIVINTNTGNIGEGINLEDFSENFQKALIVFALIPIVAVYPFVQRYFVKGIFLGSVKE